MVSIEKKPDKLLVKYSPNTGIQWILKHFQTEETFCVKKIFYVSKDEIDTCSESSIPFVSFKIAKAISIGEQTFYYFNKKTLNITFDLYISTKCSITEKWFIGERQVSIFKIIDKFWKHNELFIGCNGELAISEKEFKQVIHSLPNHTELDKYVQARICNAMKHVLRPKKDAVTEFQKYLNKRQLQASDLQEADFKDFEQVQYQHLYKKMRKMLSAPDTAYKESDWQKLIMKFIHALFPKYVVIENHPKISLSAKKRKIPDIILGDANGYVDIIEIKKPFAKGMLTAKGSTLYRDNYIPLRELSGAVMQCEKYIHYMLTHRENATCELNKQYKSVLPKGYKLQILNPCAMIIMGRSNEFCKQQNDDFELIKRKYKNIIDIITYDDLLNRLKRTAEILQQQSNTSKSN